MVPRSKNARNSANAPAAFFGHRKRASGTASAVTDEVYTDQGYLTAPMPRLFPKRLAPFGAPIWKGGRSWCRGRKTQGTARMRPPRFSGTANGRVLSEAKRMRCTQVRSTLSMGLPLLDTPHQSRSLTLLDSFPSRGSRVLWLNKGEYLKGKPSVVALS